MIVAGVGFSTGALAEDIVAVVQAASVAAQVLAAPDFKDGAALHAAAEALALPLVLITRAALEAVQPRCTTRSAVAETAVGLASVAEACALAGAGPNSRLLVTRISHERATCAVAEGFE